MSEDQSVRPVLIVDDEADALRSFEIILRTAGFKHVVTCQDSRRVPPMLEKMDPEAVILDLTLPQFTKRGTQYAVIYDQYCAHLYIM